MPEDQERQEVMRLALTHRTDIWAFLMGLAKNPNRAEELFQNTYLVICEKWRQYTLGTNFLAWARQIARYEFLASVHPAKRKHATVEAGILESVLDDAEPGAEATAHTHEYLRDCMERLTDRSRKVVRMRYWNGMACADLARKLSLSMNGVYTLLSRVRRTLLECIERKERESHA